MKLKLIGACRLISFLGLVAWVFWFSWKSFRVIGPELSVIGPLLSANGCAASIATIAVVTVWVMFPVCVGAFLLQPGTSLTRRALDALRDTGMLTFAGLFLFGILWVPIIAALPTAPSEEGTSYVEPKIGDLSDEDGSPRIRYSFERLDDDPYTTNDESNDQPLGHFGTMTLRVFSYESGNYYTLDGDIEEFDLERLYFPKGGWIDFYGCELDEDFTGECTDEEGRSWSIQGE